MDDLLKEMDDTNSDTSIVDFNFASDDEEIINQYIQPIQVIQDQVEIATKENQVTNEQNSSTKGEQDIQIQNNFEKYTQDNISSLPIYHYRQKPKLIKRKQPRECNLRQGYQIIKIFGHCAHTSYQNLQQKKEQAIIKITNYVISGVDKIRRL
ncbi:unnamed protein product [Paramecium pentaurelia]|uniref:Uncharacterized protein n=1 Tax=Paramecium pentaurelia TaxID=43138 RepID=A0A8S1TK15_9CILI|nr:unnamed protein product [Paramecium pentaurelia]